MAETYWIVWHEGGGSPTRKHSTEDAARTEARRLARNNPGSRFVVLVPCRAYEKIDVAEIIYSEPEQDWRPF